MTCPTCAHDLIDGHAPGCPDARPTVQVQPSPPSVRADLIDAYRRCAVPPRSSCRDW